MAVYLDKQGDSFDYVFICWYSQATAGLEHTNTKKNKQKP